MTIRSRPVLDRKHRPRWQDELRTQQPSLEEAFMELTRDSVEYSATTMTDATVVGADRSAA